MPYKSEKLKLIGIQDRRKKLTDEQREEIRKRYFDGSGWSLSALGSAFGVSKKTVLLIVNPHSAEMARKYQRENWREFRPTREKRNETVREHRRYKQQLYLRGELA